MSLDNKKLTFSHKGQSLVELLVAIAIFITLVSFLTFLILDSYVAGRLGAETTKAIFLAQEGIEAVRSIRDNNWQNLVPGEHGLAILGNNWILQGSAENLSDQLRGGVRKVIIEEIGLDRKKIISQVNWQFTEGRPQDIKLVTYLTNWQKITVPPSAYCTGTPTPCNQFSNQISCFGQEGCSWTDAYCEGTCTSCLGLSQPECIQQSGCRWFWFFCFGTCTSCDSFSNQTPCENQLGCSWNPAVCGGIPTSCESYTAETECLSQDGCQWVIP